MGGLVLALLCVVFCYYNQNEHLRREIKKNCSNYSDPDLENTREIIMAKMKDDIKKKLTAHIRKEYKCIMASEGKLREYKENKTVNEVASALDDKIENEVNCVF